MIVAHSLDGCLRLVKNQKGPNGRMELRSPIYPGHWVWCIWRTMDYAKAVEVFEYQSRFHAVRNESVVQPGQ